VLVEFTALLQARLGLAAAIKLARDSPAFVIEWVDDELHASGTRELDRSKKRHVNLMDHRDAPEQRSMNVRAYRPPFGWSGRVNAKSVDPRNV
jgi:hypothetical protein